jgi:predicted metal-dependent RNase
MLLEACTTSFPRVETLIMESTYGAPDDIMPPRADVERKLASITNETLRNGGKVLIPVMAVGRSQEIMLVLNDYMQKGLIMEVPIYVEGMINEVTAIHTAYPEYLSKELQSKILYENINPFQSDYFVTIKHPSGREEAMDGSPCAILATSGMLEGGPILEYLRQLASDERNTIIFVCYQIDGTLGRRVQSGLREISMLNSNGKVEIVKVRARIESVEGFSGHSDRNQIFNYLKRIDPKPHQVIICHGEKSKCLNLSSTIERMFKVESAAPQMLETLRLC